MITIVIETTGAGQGIMRGETVIAITAKMTGVEVEATIKEGREREAVIQGATDCLHKH
jgi:hypothetical protein